jgi:hypothetical protein
MPINSAPNYNCPVPDASDFDREIAVLEADLKRLEAEYNMFFAGRLPRPPWETRSRVEALLKRLDRGHIANYGNKFRLNTLQARFTTFIDLWDRGLRAREEGRPGPFAQPRPALPNAPKRPEDRILHVTTFNDPLHEIDKLRDLYHTLADARREAGQEDIPFHRFADLVKTQVASMKEKGTPEVAFRVAIKDGKLSLTARALKGIQD